MGVAVADDYFDGTSPRSRVRRHFRIARQLGAQYLRCAFSWNAIEKSPGQHDWSFWDMLVSEAERAHIELIPYVAYTPRWAAVSQQNFWEQPPRNSQLYADFMQRIVARYRGRIHAWEIWNEPDNQEYWRGSVETYAQLVRAAAAAMRRTDPSVVLVLGGMSRGPEPFFQALLPQVAGYVDVIAMHAYPESWDEERTETVFQNWPAAMESLIDQHSPGADFWINEMGYADFRFSSSHASEYGISVFYDYEHTLPYQADVLFKMEVMALASPRVSLTAWYRIDDFSPATTHFSNDEVNFHLGLLDSRGQRKPSFYALKFFGKLFREPVTSVPVKVCDLSGCVPPPTTDAVVHAFRRSNSELIVTGWLRSSLPSEVADFSGKLHDTRGRTVSIQLPCKSIVHARTYDVEGHARHLRIRFANGNLTGVPLSGDQVFVEVLRCRE